MAKDVYNLEESRMCHQDLLSPLGIGTEGEEKSQQVVCYIAGDETRLDLEEREKSEDLNIAYLFGRPTCFPGRHGLWVPRECLPEL